LIFDFAKKLLMFFSGSFQAFSTSC